MIIDNSTFNSNAASKQQEFTENEEVCAGGAIAAVEGARVGITEGKFSNNKAVRDGGAIYARRSTLNINKSEFNTNTADRYGGAILNKGLTRTMNITGSEFSDNKADSGGVIYASDTTINIDRSEFIMNRADIEGGAIDIFCPLVAEVVSVRFSGSVFCNNKADNGGAINARKVTVTINNSDFTENRAEAGVLYISESNILFSGNTTIANNNGSLFLFNSEFNITQNG